MGVEEHAVVTSMGSHKSQELLGACPAQEAKM